MIDGRGAGSLTSNQTPSPAIPEETAGGRKIVAEGVAFLP
jgi:hypothetical protein